MPIAPVPGPLRERALAKLLPQNGLLAALSDDARARLLPHLGLVDLRAGHQLGEPGGSFARVFFPVAGVVSLMHGTADAGERVSALVGSEGVVGLPRFMSDAALTRAVVQYPGYGLALGREQLLEEWSRGGSLMRLLMRYSRALAAQRAVLTACRSLHAPQQQLAVMLLLSLERLDGQEVVLGEDDSARLMGCSVVQARDAIEGLRGAGVAAWRRPGAFAVRDRAGLGPLSCGCEGRVASEYRRLLPRAGELAGAGTTSSGWVPEAAIRRQRREASMASGGQERPRS